MTPVLVPGTPALNPPGHVWKDRRWRKRRSQRLSGPDRHYSGACEAGSLPRLCTRVGRSHRHHSAVATRAPTERQGASGQRQVAADATKRGGAGGARKSSWRTQEASQQLPLNMNTLRSNGRTFSHTHPTTKKHLPAPEESFMLSQPQQPRIRGGTPLETRKVRETTDDRVLVGQTSSRETCHQC